MRVKYIYIVLFVISLFNCSNYINAQQYLDKKYYLVDSLDAEEISDYDKLILDSILNIFHKSNEDTVKLFQLDYLVEHLMGDDLWRIYNIEMNRFSQELLTQKIKESGDDYEYFTSYYIRSINNFGYSEAHKGNYDNALKYYLEALKMAEEVHNSSRIGEITSNIAFIERKKGNFEEALRLYLKALNDISLVKNENSAAVYQNYIGEMYSELGNIDKAMEYFHKSLIYHEKSNNKHELVKIYLSIASTYKNQKDFISSLNYYRKALNISLNIGNKELLGSNFNNLGELYLELYQYDSALFAFEKSLFYRKEIDDKSGLISNLYNLGNIYLLNGNNSKAFQYYTESFKISDSIGEKLGIIYSMAGISKVYLAENDIIKSNLESNKAYLLAKEIGSPNIISLIASLNYQTNYALGNYKEAFNMYKLSIQMRDSVQNEENKKATYKQQMKYEYEKKEEELKAQDEKRKLAAEQDQKVRDTIIYAVSGGFGLSIIFLFFLYSRFQVIRKQKHLIEEQSENLHKAYRELHELQQFKDGMTGMIVHDLKNPLNAMLGYAEEVQSVNLKTRIRNTSRMMLNYVLNMLDVQKFESQQVPLEQHQQPFAEVLHQAIEQVAFLAQEKNITINNKIKRNYIVNLDEELIGRVIVNLLTNAIKYSPLKSTITIDAGATSDKQLKVMIADQGQGIPKDMLDKVFDKFTQVEAKRSGKIKSTGLGLTFCKLVVEGHAGKIWVESEEGRGSQFYFTIPLLSDAGELLSTINKEEISSKDLTEEEQATISLIKVELSKLSVMDSIEIMEVLEKARVSSSLAINNWANEVENACLNMDEEHYISLLGA